MPKYGKKVGQIERKPEHLYYVTKTGAVMESPMAQMLSPARKKKVTAKPKEWQAQPEPKKVKPKPYGFGDLKKTTKKKS